MSYLDDVRADPYNPKHYTHEARYLGVPCYWNDDESMLVGRNWFFDMLLRFYATPLDQVIIYLASIVAQLMGVIYEPGFRIYARPITKDARDDAE